MRGGLLVQTLRMSNIRDHSRADQHIYTMMLLKQERAKTSCASSSSYSPIAKGFKQAS